MRKVTSNKRKEPEDYGVQVDWESVKPVRTDFPWKKKNVSTQTE